MNLFNQNFNPGPGDSLHLADDPNHEPHIGDFLKSYIAPGDTFIDVGAHVGYFTCMGAEAVGPNGLVVAFEPSPKAFKILKENAEHRKNVRGLNIALGEEEAEGILWEQTEGWGQNSLSEALVDRGKYEATPVYIGTLDDMMSEHESIDWEHRGELVLKSDTQGNEVNVLKGAKTLLDEKLFKVMALELWPLGLEERGSSVDELYSLLKDFNIFTHIITPGGNYHLVPCPLEEAKRIYGELDGQRKHGDILCIRK